MSEQDKDLPRWIPYSAPPANAWDRTHDFFRGLLFPVTVVLFGIGLWAGLHWLSQPQDQRARTNVQVNSTTEPPSTPVDASSGTAQLTIQSRPEGASVWINGDSVATTPLREHSIEPGVYFLSLRAQNHLNSDTVVTLASGSSQELTFSLDARPGPRSEPTSRATLAEQSQDRESPSENPSSSSASDASDPQQSESPSPSSESSPPASTEAESTSDEEDPPPATGTLHITSDPEGAVVVIDERRRGRTPLTLEEMPTGSYELTLQHVGYASWSSTVTAEANATRNVHGALKPLRGRLRILAQPWGTIYIDDSLHARESDIWYETELPVGEHRIRVVHPSLGEETRVVNLEAEEENEITVNLREDDSEKRR